MNNAKYIVGNVYKCKSSRIYHIFLRKVGHHLILWDSEEEPNLWAAPISSVEKYMTLCVINGERSLP